MANRTVSVNLELLAAQYKGEADAVIAKTLEMDHEVEALDRDINKLGPDAAKAAAAMALLGQEHGRLAGQADQAADRVDHIGEAIKKTDEEITRSKTLIQELAAEFGRTGDLDLVKKISGEQSNVGRLQKLRADLEGIKADAEKASKEMEKLLAGAGNTGKGLLDFALDEWVAHLAKAARTGIQDGVNSAASAISGSPVIATAVIAGIAAGLPILTALVGTAIGTGVALGFGTGVIATGIKLGLEDTRARAAWSAMGADIKGVFTEASGPFVAPLISGAHAVGAAFRDEEPQIAAAFARLAPVVDDLGAGVAGFVHELGPGLDKLASFSAPFLQDLAAWLPELGAHLKEFIDRITNAGPGVRMFFNDVLDLTLSVVDALGTLVQWGAKVYEGFAALGALITGDFTGAQQRIVDMGNASAKSFGGFHNDTINVNTALGLLNGTMDKTASGGVIVKDSLAGAAQAFTKLNTATRDTFIAQAVDRFLNASLGLDRATLGIAQAQTQLGDTLKQNTVSWRNHSAELDINTVKGQANRSAVLGVVAANIAEYDAMIKAHAGADVAAAAYDANTAALERQLHAAGLTQGQIDGLIGKYREVPKNIDTDVAMHGLTDAIGSLDDAIRAANGLDGRTVNMFVKTYYSTYGDVTLPGAPAGRNAIRAYAEGGIYPGAATGLIADQPMLVGERTVPEAAIPAPNSGISRQRAGDLLGTAAGWWGMGVSDWQGGRVVSAAGAGGGGRSEVTHRVVIQEPSGRRIAELVIEDGRNGGVAFNAYIRQVASR